VPQYAALGLDIVPLIDASGGIGGLHNLLKNPGPFIAAAQWYVDHAMVLNTTKRASWLSWAKRRKLSSVWIAPHATDVDLIEIPGVEGSHADDVIFCDFIREADGIGVDVQLFASPMNLTGKGADEVDLRFAINCTKSMLKIPPISLPHR